MEGGKGGNNYWPGFVDALTNVVIAMVFVIVVLAIALSFAAQLMGKRVADEAIKKHIAEAAAKDKSAATSAAAMPPPESPPSRLPVHTRIAVQGKESAASAAGGALRENRNLLQLDFIPSALTLDAAAAGKLKQALAASRASAPQSKVQVVAVGPDLQLSENQRSAYVRVMAVRNELLEAGYSAERISVRIDTQRRAAAPSVTISINPP